MSTMIRTKTYADREVIPKLVTVGEPIWVQRDGKWFNKDNLEVEVLTMTLSELIEYLKQRSSY